MNQNNKFTGYLLEDVEERTKTYWLPGKGGWNGGQLRYVRTGMKNSRKKEEEERRPNYK
jgi:hypothetical protein